MRELTFTRRLQIGRGVDVDGDARVFDLDFQDPRSVRLDDRPRSSIACEAGQGREVRGAEEHRVSAPPLMRRHVDRIRAGLGETLAERGDGRGLEQRQVAQGDPYARVILECRDARRDRCAHALRMGAIVNEAYGMRSQSRPHSRGLVSRDNEDRLDTGDLEGSHDSSDKGLAIDLFGELVERTHPLR